MRVWAAQNQKGGVGKSTIVAMLAAYAEQCGETTLIIDLDPQTCCLDWHEKRGTNKPMVVAGVAKKLPDLLQSAQNFGVSLVLIDTAPHSTEDSIVAISHADLIIVPGISGLFDETGLRDTAKLLSYCGLFSKAIGVPNLIPHTSIKEDYAETALQMERYGIKVSKSYMCVRRAYRKCLSKGQGVTEFRPNDKKAIEEIQKLWVELNSITPLVTPKKEEAL
jgi:cellulose biosynthesis protein BcsQ